MNFEDRQREAVRELREICNRYKVEIAAELQMEQTEEGVVLNILPAIIIKDDALRYTSKLVKN